jgi:ATP synthase protein I
MKQEDRKYYKQLALASTIGLQVAFSIFIGLAIGVWLDKKFGTFPWLALLFLIFGVAAGFMNYYRFIVNQRKDEEGPGK